MAAVETAEMVTAVEMAVVEMEIVDASTNWRLAAAVDKRGGGKTVVGSIDTWADVKEACDYWAERLKERLGELRARKELILD